MMDLGLLAARLMLSLVFVLSGLDKSLHWAAGVGEIEAAGMPHAAAMLALTVATQLLGGLSVALGFRARWGALALAGFTAAATLLFHGFWQASGEAWQHQFTTFMEHVAIIGGFIAIVATGPGRFSLDRLYPPRDVLEHLLGGTA
jgi:putative oxidoreductase